MPTAEPPVDDERQGRAIRTFLRVSFCRQTNFWEEFHVGQPLTGLRHRQSSRHTKCAAAIFNRHHLGARKQTAIVLALAGSSPILVTPNETHRGR